MCEYNMITMYYTKTYFNERINSIGAVHIQPATEGILDEELTT